MSDFDVGHRRKSRRHLTHDYYGGADYFVTICALQRQAMFAEIIDGRSHWMAAGRAIFDTWMEIPDRFPHVGPDAFVIMPEHFHGLLRMKGDRSPASSQPAIGEPLGRVIAWFKYISTKRINTLRDNPGVPVWQRNYHDRVLRDGASLESVRCYILENPLHHHIHSQFVSDYPNS